MKNIPEQLLYRYIRSARNLRVFIFFHPDFTVGPGISPGLPLRLAGCTASQEFHPALKI